MDNTNLIKIIVKYRPQTGIFVKIDIGNILKFPFSKFLDDVCLSTLVHTGYEQGFRFFFFHFNNLFKIFRSMAHHLDHQIFN